MNHINKKIKNTLKVILSVMIVFSSVLVVNPSPIISEEIVEEEKTELVEEVVETKEELPNEIVEEVKQETEKEDEEVVEETKEETPTEVEEVTETEEQLTEETEPTEEVETVEQKPLLTMAPMLLSDSGSTQKYTVTFYNGFRKIDSIEVEAGSTINTNDIPADRYADWRSASKTPVWYYREGTLLIYKEHKWNFTNMTVDKNITLYVKYENVGTSGNFDFRVKHEQSDVLPEFNTGTYTNVEDGYTYSYYTYETGVEFSYTEGETDDKYTGSSFDLAIQESNPGDTIEILKNMTITQPINIWGDVNLNLNEKTITCDTNFITKIINFINDFWEMLGGKQPLIRVKDNFSPAIFVYNARTTISNGTIDNKKGELGHGIVVYSEKPEYVTYLKGVKVTTASGADAVSAGYEGTRTNEQGLPTQAFATGYAVITSGWYEGKIVNYNQEGSLIVNGGNFTINPTANNAQLGTDRYLYKNQSGDYDYYVSDYSYEAVIVNENGVEISNETFVSALNKATTGQKIKIVKNITLSSNLVIDPNGRSLTIDVYGHNITSDNNSKISIIDSGSGNQGEVVFVNSDKYFNGQVDVAIEANSKGIVIIENGYYKSANGSNMKVKGGYFVGEVNSSYLYNENYTCYRLDQSFNEKYYYKVVDKNNKYVAKIGETNYTSLVTAINSATASDTITILQDIDLLESITINKTLKISLPSGININSYALNSFVITGKNTVVSFVGTNSNVNNITNKALANGNEVAVFSVGEESKLILQNISVNAEAKNCGNNKLITINTTGTYANIELNATKINISNKESLNKHIVGIQNNFANSKINITSNSAINLTPCNGGCLDMTAIYNSGNQSTINVIYSDINMYAIGNQTDYINYKGLQDVSSNSSIKFDCSFVTITNDKGNTCAIEVDNNSKLSVINATNVSLNVVHDNISTHVQTAIISKGESEIINSKIIADSKKGSVKALDFYGIKATLSNATVTATASEKSNCIVADENAQVSIVDDGYYYSSNAGQAIDCGVDDLEILAGHFSDDVTPWTARNYICKNKIVTEGNTYNYVVEKSGCKLSLSVANDGTIVINYKIAYDPYMLNNPDKFAINFTSSLSQYNDKTFKISDTPTSSSVDKDGVTLKIEPDTNRYVYSFSIPARLMDTIIGGSIINKESGHIYHLLPDYSIKDYYYTILGEKQTGTEIYKHSNSMRDLAAATLNYGAYCQQNLGDENERITDPTKLVNYLLDTYFDANGNRYKKEFDGTYDTEIENQESKANKTGELLEDFKNIGHSLLLKGSTTLRLRFDLVDENLNIQNYKAYYRNASDPNSEFVEITPGKDVLSRYLDIPGIKSYNFDNIFELKIEKGTSSCLITYRPLDYICSEYKETSGKTLAEALYTYFKMARKYYGGK